MNPFGYRMPTEIVFGAGTIHSLSQLQGAVGKKPLILVGKDSARRSGLLDLTLKQLPNAEVFEGIDENPTTTVCEEAAAECRRKRCGMVIGLGGGSVIDAAKAVAVLARNKAPCSDFFGGDQYQRSPLPVIAIPTTAGTGTEVTPYAVIVCDAESKKRTISGSDLFPCVAILDPELSLTLPRGVTVNTGLDALSQALEGMASTRSTHLGDQLALEACRIVHRWLPIAAEKGTDIEARTQMLYAAMLSGCVIAQSGTTLVHGMGYYLTLEFGIPHGLANALLLAPIFRHNAGLMPEKVANMAKALGRPARHTGTDAGFKIVEAIYELLARLNVSRAAKDAGADLARLSWCSQDIYNDQSRFKNQIGDLSLADVERFFEESYRGVLSSL